MNFNSTQSDFTRIISKPNLVVGETPKKSKEETKVKVQKVDEDTDSDEDDVSEEE